MVAYFCAEFGFHESFQIYSGGLGILAGDHCKAASDLSIPFVAVGMLYRQGYFTQTIDAHGNQVAHYAPTHFGDLPIFPAIDADGKEIHVQVDMPGRRVMLKVWKAKAGHISLYLLDSDLPENAEADRRITYQLYGGDSNTRIQQEIVLGIGGVRALQAVGLKPTVWHINEGPRRVHGAGTLPRARERQGLDFDTALEFVAANTVFTTHTPVPAGHDHLRAGDDGGATSAISCASSASTREQFLALGHDARTARRLQHDGAGAARLALPQRRLAHPRRASPRAWPRTSGRRSRTDENPMGYVTNGVHVPTFLAREWANLFDMRFGSGWRNELLNEDYLEAH